jgi:hypothetical protein
MVSAAGLTFALLFAQAGAGQAPATPAPQPCAAALYQQFDFWVGQWDVYPNGKDQLVAHSRIEKLYGGCAIRENWMPVKGTGGGSLSAPDPLTGRWHQYWLDSSGSQVEFDGGLVKDKMVLVGYWKGINGPGQDGLVRMSYTRLDADTVRQFGELSTDQGLTWSTNFDFIYRRGKPVT